MSRKKRTTILIIGAVVLNIVISILCVRLAFFAALKLLFAPPAGERVETATDLPSYAENATDARVTYIHRTDDVMVKLEHLFYGVAIDSTEPKVPCIQFLYGYKVDDIWIDIPAENYPLFYLEEGSKVIAFGCPSHITKVGNHALICIVDPYKDTVPHDTLGTVPLTPIDELFDDEPTTIEYGLILDDRERILKWNEPAYSVVYGDLDRYYFLLNLDELPENYELHFSTNEYSQETKNFYTEYILTAEDIGDYMELAEEQINSQ